MGGYGDIELAFGGGSVLKVNPVKAKDLCVELGHLSTDQNRFAFAWIVDFPIYERDAETGRYEKRWENPRLQLSYVNAVLADDAIRQGIKDYSDWPTVPQLYVKGEFVGGCDIITEMTLSGELDTLFTESGVTFDQDAANKIREANA